MKEIQLNNPLLTIMVPVYNQEKLLLKALESIPFRKDIEILIIDDCSTDNSYEVANEWAKNNLKYFSNIIVKRNEENKGCGYSKNWAYTQAQGKYIITLDSDDYLYKTEYNNVLNRLSKQDADIIFISNKINNGKTWSRNDRKATWSYFAKNEFLKKNNLNYNPEARRAGDWELTRKIQQLPRVEETWHIIAYHYNYPREGSIVWNYEHGEK